MVMMLTVVAFVERMKKLNETHSGIFRSCETSFLSKG